jgi:hypothetical protein
MTSPQQPGWHAPAPFAACSCCWMHLHCPCLLSADTCQRWWLRALTGASSGCLQPGECAAAHEAGMARQASDWLPMADAAVMPCSMHWQSMVPHWHRCSIPLILLVSALT